MEHKSNLSLLLAGAGGLLMLLFLLSNDNIGVKAGNDCSSLAVLGENRCINTMGPDGYNCIWASMPAMPGQVVKPSCYNLSGPFPSSTAGFGNDSGEDDSRQLQVDCSQYGQNNCPANLNCKFDPSAGGSSCYSCRPIAGSYTCDVCNSVGSCVTGNNNSNSRNISSITGEITDSTPPAFWDFNLPSTSNPIPPTNPTLVDPANSYRAPPSNFFNSLVNNCARANNVGSESGCSIRNPQAPPDSCIIFNRLKQCNKYLSECKFNFTTSLCEQITTKNGNPINW